MIITTSPLALPFVFLIWVLDAGILLVSARSVLPHIRTPWATRALAAASGLVDGPLTRIHRLVSRRWPRASISVVTVLLLFTCLVVRQLIIGIILELS